ncbi:hypothetical protein [Paenibacillus sp. NPDC058071]|uniref:hypothetical protein n=1 Tax=Paenibacillus sp. NPDC058071 TaxID=3346326 RepID=UPI0036DDC4AA
MSNKTKMWFQNYKIWMLQLFGFSLTALAFFYLIQWVNPFLIEDKFVMRTADNVYHYREFILNLVFRVVPILIPIIIATASLLLNRYTSIYLSILFEDKNIKRLLIFCSSFFIFHSLVILYTPLETWSDKNLYYISHYLYFFLDAILSLILLSYSIYTCIQVFFYAQPSKLSVSFTYKINKVTTQITKSLFHVKPQKYQFKVAQNTAHLKKYIANFTNLIVLAVKSKDTETIRDSVHRLGYNIWTLILQELKEVDFEEKRKMVFKEYKKEFTGFGTLTGFSNTIDDSDQVRITDHTNRRMDSLVGETNATFNQLEEQIVQVYKDVFETAFATKEYFACDTIIANLQEKGVKQRSATLKITVTLAQLFEVAISHNHTGYTQYYCEKLISTLEKIYIDTAFEENPLKDLDAYYIIMKSAIYHKNHQIFKYVLKSLRNVLDTIKVTAQSEMAYKNILYAGMYCLDIKSMKCFATLIRYLVTEKFDLVEVNNTIAKINFLVTKQTVQLENDIFLNFLNDSAQNKNEENIFNISKEKRYLLLKFYIVLFSYFRLQTHISSDRISPIYSEMSVNYEFKGTIPFYNIRTVLLDLEAHSKKWNELFIGQCQNYFIDTATELVILSELDKLEQDIFLENSNYLKCLKEKTNPSWIVYT